MTDTAKQRQRQQRRYDHQLRLGPGNANITGILGSSVTAVVQNSATSGLTLRAPTAALPALTIQNGTLTASTSSSVLGTGGTITLGSGSNAATLLVSVNGTFANPFVLNGNTSGVLEVTNAGSIVDTYNGGVTGTGNLSILSQSGSGNITFSTNPINNTGTITCLTGGSNGPVTISGGIGDHVTALTLQNGAGGADRQHQHLCRD